MQARKIPVDVFNRQVRQWFMEGMEESMNSGQFLYKTAANLRDLKNPLDIVATFSGGGYYAQHGEWEPARFFEPGSGWKITANPSLYKSSFRVPDTLTDYEMSGDGWVAKQTRLLGDYGIQTLDAIFVNLLNNGFSANFPTYDGQPLFSLNHPLRNANGVFANTAAAAALDETSLAAALTYFLDMPNDDGMRFGIQPKYLIVPITRLLQATRLLGSFTQIGQANPNVISTVAGKLEIATSPKLTSSTAWFVSAAPSKLEGSGHGLDLWFPPSGMPKTTSRRLEDPDGYKYIGSFRTAALATKLRGIYGNPGL